MGNPYSGFILATSCIVAAAILFQPALSLAPNFAPEPKNHRHLASKAASEHKNASHLAPKAAPEHKKLGAKAASEQKNHSHSAPKPAPQHKKLAPKAAPAEPAVHKHSPKHEHKKQGCSSKLKPKPAKKPVPKTPKNIAQLPKHSPSTKKIHLSPQAAPSKPTKNTVTQSPKQVHLSPKAAPHKPTKAPIPPKHASSSSTKAATAPHKPAKTSTPF